MKVGGMDRRDALRWARKSPTLVLALFNRLAGAWEPVLRTDAHQEAVFLMFEGIHVIGDRRHKWALLGAASVDDDDVEAALRRLDPDYDFRLLAPAAGEA